MARRVLDGRVGLRLGSGRLVLVLLLSGCALPPPPGAFFAWSHVEPFEMPSGRPLAPVVTDWQAFVHGTTPVAGDCGVEACGQDAPAWVERCLQPRAEVFAQRAIAHLKSTGDWHAQGLARLGQAATIGPAPATSDRAICVLQGSADAVVARVLQAIGRQAAAEWPSACRAPSRVDLAVEVAEVDHARQGLGDFVVHDMPSIFTSTLLGIMTLGTVTTMSDMVHRVVTLQLTLQDDAAGPTRIEVRGAAGISLGSLKMIESGTPPPPELVSVAFVEALRKLDSAMRSQPGPGCQDTVHPHPTARPAQ